MHSHEHIDIQRTLEGPLPFVPYEKIAAVILGRHYDLSITLCGDTLARRIFREHRLPSLKLRQPSKKTYSPNVLSFPYDHHSGEIFLNLRKAVREAHRYPSILKPANQRSVAEHTLYLYVHGCLHLKGLDHGKKMDAEEVRLVRIFSK